MPKPFRKSPTLLQTLLNKPSQSYAYPQVDRKDYYSSKNEMIKTALVEGETAGVQVPVEYRNTGLEAATLRTLRLTSHSETVRDQNVTPAEEVYPQHHSRSLSLPEVILTEEPESSTSTDESDSDNDVFYTPNASPRTSSASTVTITMSSRPPASSTWPSSQSLTTGTIVAPTRHNGRSTPSTSSTSADSTSVDGLSVFSSHASSSGSTGITTPEPSIRSSSSRKGKQRAKSTGTMVNGMGQDWAKDVRWLVPPPSTASSSSSASKRKIPSKTQTTPHSSRPPNSRHSDVKHFHHATMTVVLEEDEGASSVSLVHSPSSSQSRTRAASNASSSKRSGKRAGPSSVPPARPHLMRRKSRSLEDLAALQAEDEVLSSSSTPSSSYTAPPLHTPSLPSYGTPGYTSLTLPRAPPPSSGFLESGKVGKVDLTRSGIAQTTMASVEVTRGLSTVSSSKRISWLSKDKDWGKGKGRAEGAFSFTSYRKPPTHVPEGHVLVQVWAVGIDNVDASICGISIESRPEYERRTASESGRVHSDATVKRSWSLRRNQSTTTYVVTSHSKPKQPEVGFVPGRSFVGRVMEVGDEDEGMRIIKKGEWVVGLLDVRKCGALQEFIVVDRHRIHSVPHPSLPPSVLIDQISMPPPSLPSSSSLSPANSEHKPHDSRYPVYTPTPAPLYPDSARSVVKTQLTLEELALLPTCGVQAYRAIRTFSSTAGPAKKVKGRILVLNGHDGAGAMATQMLVRRGWEVCVHASPHPELNEREEEEEMGAIQARVKDWGADEVIFDDSIVGAIQLLIDEKEVFDGILDTVGGKEVWEVGKKLLSGSSGVENVKQFTTLVGDFPMRPIPSASDHFKASLRSMKGGDGIGLNKVGYTWVSIDQDIDFEGVDVSDGIGRVLGECASVSDFGPFVGGPGRVVTFERAHEIFRGSGSLAGGGTLVVRVVL
ncbi:hypothetical protein L218DRAFT_1074976 [Marasmius fiardii PR-910]|nr:hypothetical protein L218DRAFT_1074976 [Marasmius fiardii PR-910]